MTDPNLGIFGKPFWLTQLNFVHLFTVILKLWPWSREATGTLKPMIVGNAIFYLREMIKERRLLVVLLYKLSP